MKKYLTYFYTSVLYQLEYRADLVGKVLISALPFVGFFFLWRTLYSQGSSFGSYSLGQLISYFLVSAIVGHITPSFMAVESLAENIRTGFLSTSLVKPVSFPFYQLTNFMGDRATRTLVSLVVIAGITVFLSGQVAYPTHSLVWLLFIVSVIFSVMLSYWVYFDLAIVDFWLVRSTGYAFAIAVIGTFLSGGTIPLDLLPHGLQVLTNVLPFGYIIFFPTQIFLGQLSTGQVISGLFIQLTWLILSFLVSFPLWKVGLKKYESVGA